MSSNDSENKTGCLVAIVLVLVYFAYQSSYQKRQTEKRKADDAHCQIDAQCQDDIAMANSNFSPPGIAVRSTTGRYFFRGEPCLDSCGRHIAGYKWAISKGITQESACVGDSESFERGCKIAVNDRIQELQDDQSN